MKVPTHTPGTRTVVHTKARAGRVNRPRFWDVLRRALAGVAW